MAEILIGQRPDGERVAIKRLHARLAGDAELRARFGDETRLALELVHPHIVRASEVTAIGDLPAIVMELLEGRNAAELLEALARRGERLPIPIALAIAVRVLEALDHAHELADEAGVPKNVVHRDVSASNVFLTWTGDVKLLDFGVARADDRVLKTEDGTVRGKVPYMSPEQCRGLTIDRRSDVFSAGVLIYELITAQRPFVDEGDYGLMRRIVEEQPPLPSMLAPGLTARLDHAILAALAKPPEARPATARALAHELRQAAKAAGLELGDGPRIEGLPELLAVRVGPVGPAIPTPLEVPAAVTPAELGLSVHQVVVSATPIVAPSSSAPSIALPSGASDPLFVTPNELHPPPSSLPQWPELAHADGPTALAPTRPVPASQVWLGRLADVRGRALAAALVAIAIWEIGVLVQARVSAPTDADWRAATAAVDAAIKPGELVVFAPAWVDPVGRRWLGHHLSLDEAGRMDAARYAGIWEVTIRGAVAPDVRGLGAPASDTRHGAVRVRHFVQAPATVTWDLGARAGLYEVGFTPRRCLRVGAPQPGGPPARQKFTDVELGTELVVAAGLTDFRARKENWSTARLAVLVDGVEVSSGELTNEGGWVHLAPAVTTPGRHEVILEATVARVGEKTDLGVCVAAEARTPAAAAGGPR